MAQKFKTSISIQELATAASQALGIKLYGENFNRLQVDAGGKITWGAGASAGDVNLYRSDAQTLTTDDIFHAVAGIITLTTSGAPTAAMADGALAIDTDNDAFYFRSNSTWQQVTGGGGSASVTVSDDAPVAPDAGNLWYESDTGSMYIYYDDGDTSQWVEVGGSAVVAMTTSDTAPASANNGDLWFETDTGKTYVRYDDGTSAQWVEIGAASALSAQGPDGSIQFANTGSLDSSPDLYWDDANSRLGIGTNTPAYTLDVDGDAYISQNAEVDGVLTANHIHGNIAGSLYLHVKNTSGSSIAAGTPIYATGSVGASGATEVSPSDASSSSTMPSLGILQETLAHNAEGHATVLGVIGNLNTSTYAVNTSLYIAPGGGLTLTRPTASSDLVQKIGRVIRSDASTGEILVLGAGRTNDIPNDVTLGTDTIGDYVESLVAGTGVTLANNTGEGATPTIEIGQSVGTTDNVTFNTVTADLTGNASTASALATARTINLGGDLSGSASFDGSADITISATVSLDSVALGTDTTGDYIESLTAGTGVTVYNGTGEGASAGIAIGQDVGTTSSVTFASVTADLTGNVTGDVTGDLTGNADTATTLQTARTIELSGDVAGSVSFDGSGDVVISTTVQADSVALGTDTTGDFIESISAGTGVTVYNGTGEGASAGIAIGQDVATSANVTFNDLILTGNLTVQGTTTTLETDTLQVEDNIIVLNYGQATPSLDAGIEIERGSGTNVRLQWDEANDIWEFTNDGTTYYPLVTTLGDISNIDFTTPPSTNDFLKFDGTNWIAASIPEINSLSDIGNVTITSIASGEYLKWNGTAWVNDAINLGTDTAGDYVESVTGGTGVTIYGGTGEGASATIEIGQDVSTSASASFDLVTGTSGVITTTTTGEPTAALPDGALAIDTTNDRFYFRSNSTWNLVSGGAGITVSDTAPSSPTAGQLWYESDTGIMLIYYDDGDTQQWVEVGGISGISASLTDAAPSNPYVGDIWFDTTSGRTYLYYDDGSSGQWVEIGATGDDLATVASGAPASPSIGQMWYDTLNEQLLVYDGTSWLASAGATATVSPTEPTGPDEGDLWYDTANGEMFIYSGTEWLSAGGGASVTVQDTAPADPEEGDMWFESDTGRLLVYYDSTWVEVGGSGGSGGTTTATTITSSSTDAALFIMQIGP